MPNSVVFPEARVRTHPKVTQSDGEGGGGERKLLELCLGEPGVQVLVTHLLVIRCWEKECVPQFPHLSVGDINSTSS